MIGVARVTFRATVMLQSGIRQPVAHVLMAPRCAKPTPAMGTSCQPRNADAQAGR